jgi:eukaryotic-like serine/threonine-protein kinase
VTLQGRVLAGRYALGALLGAGGMAQVYRARDRVLQRTVAVKVLSAPYDQDPDLVARFGREARAAAALSHPNIVTIYDSGADGDLHYLVMEYVEGETLAALLRRAGRWPLAGPRWSPSRCARRWASRMRGGWSTATSRPATCCSAARGW